MTEIEITPSDWWERARRDSELARQDLVSHGPEQPAVHWPSCLLFTGIGECDCRTQSWVLAGALADDLDQVAMRYEQARQTYEMCNRRASHAEARVRELEAALGGTDKGRSASDG